MHPHTHTHREGKHLRKEHGREERKGREWGRKGEGCREGRRGVRKKMSMLNFDPQCATLCSLSGVL